MSKIILSGTQKLDMQGQCRNWKQDLSGTQRRMGNNSRALQELASAVNDLLARHPRPMFTQAWSNSSTTYIDMDPSLIWKYKDTVKNGRNHRYIITGFPYITTETGTSSYVTRYPEDDVNSTVHYTNMAFVNYWGDVWHDEFIANRGNETNTEVSFGVKTVGSYKILGLCVYDEPLDSLETSIHTYCEPLLSRKGGRILADALEDIRAKFHKVRSENLPIVLCWSAFGLTGGSDPGDQFGFVITEDSFVNILDHTITSRSAVSPGARVDAKYWGRGPEWSDSGKLCKVMCRVYGYTNGNTGRVRFYGSDVIADNYTEITITSTPGWFGDSTNFIYLDTQETTQDNDYFTTADNKIDVMALVNNGNYLSIQALSAWVEYT